LARLPTLNLRIQPAPLPDDAIVGRRMRAGSTIKITMKITRFVVKVNRGGALATQYVQRIDRTPIQTTTDRRLALIMGRFTAEDAAKSIQTSRCTPELVSVQATV
jgi:hypothetical protein